MEPTTAFLFAMQAAGLVTSIFGAKAQQKYIKLGRKLEQEQFETNLEAVRLQSSAESLDQLKALKYNIGAQTVMSAARGNKNGNAWGITQSTNSYNNDERKRRLNLMANESQLRAGNVLSNLNSLKSETQLGQQTLEKVFNTIPTTSLLNIGKTPKNNSETFNWGY